MYDIENALAVRVVTADGTDITDRVTLTGEIPDIELTAEPDVARTIVRVEMQSPRSELWCRVNVDLSDQEFLARGIGPLFIDARVRYAD